MAQTLLKVKGLQVAYGGIQAVKGVDMEVHEGELVSLIGSNGAGKTTTMKAITGTQPMQAGEIEYLGQSIKGQGPWDLVKQGLAMVPEGRGVFTRMTIIENLQMGAYTRSDKAEVPAMQGSSRRARPCRLRPLRRRLRWPARASAGRVRRRALREDLWTRRPGPVRCGGRSGRVRGNRDR